MNDRTLGTLVMVSGYVLMSIGLCKIHPGLCIAVLGVVIMHSGKSLAGVANLKT
jgi:hypothetical protein